VRVRRLAVDRGSDGEGEIRARVAVGDWIDVEVAMRRRLRSSESSAARKLARSFDGHAVN
jgi:hypothetical protein